MTQDENNREKAYRPRVVDAQVDEYLKTFGGVVVEGAKWCGKTWTGLRHAADAVYVDDPDTRQLADLAPKSLLQRPRPLLVDEWQDAPVLWDVARRQIDEAGKPGQFLFTGSAVPPLEATSHTGTGRFARLRMRPMSLMESGDSTGQVSLGELMRGETERLDPSVSQSSYQDVVRLVCRGGWPASVGQSDRTALLRAREYIRAVAESDISRSDGVARDPRRVMAVLRSLARNSASFAQVPTIQGDVAAQEGGETVSAPAVRAYLKALDRIFVTEDLQPWRFALRSKSQLLLSPKRHFVDPSLAVAALDTDPEHLEADPNTVGYLFESLVVRDLRVYAQANDGEVFHYHDNKGLEADAIVESRAGWGAVEVKVGSQQEEEAAASLLRLRDKMAGEPAIPAPRFLLAVTGTGRVAHTREDGVHVVPINQLGV